MADASDIAWVSRYEGLALAEIHEMALNAGREVRIIPTGQRWLTLDFRRDRLNVKLADAESVEQVFAG